MKHLLLAILMAFSVVCFGQKDSTAKKADTLKPALDTANIALFSINDLLGLNEKFKQYFNHTDQHEAIYNAIKFDLYELLNRKYLPIKEGKKN